MPDRRFDKFFCHSYYVLFGAVGMGLLPALNKRFEEAYDLSHSQMGSALAMSALMFAMGSLISGRWYDRAGARRPFAACTCCCALGAVALYVVPTAFWFVLVLQFFVLAQGLGALVTPFTGKLYGQEQAHGITLLHGMQAFGRLLAPLVVTLCLFLFGHWRLALIVSAAFFGMWFFLAAFGIRDDGKARGVSSAADTLAESKSANMWRDPWLWLGLSAFFFTSGAEYCMVMWVANFLESESGFAPTTALWALTFMMGGTMGIRFLSGILRGLARPVWIAAFGVLFVASYFVLISAGSAAVVYFAALALGVSIGLFWPSQAAAVHSYAPGSQGAVMGLYTLFCTLGVAVFASVIGALGDRVGLRRALLVAVAGELIFVVMHVVFCAGTARKRRDSSRGHGGTGQEAQKAASEDRD